MWAATNCFEEGIRGIPDLKGKTVGVPTSNSSLYMFVSSMASKTP